MNSMKKIKGNPFDIRKIKSGILDPYSRQVNIKLFFLHPWIRGYPSSSESLQEFYKENENCFEI